MVLSSTIQISRAAFCQANSVAEEHRRNERHLSLKFPFQFRFKEKRKDRCIISSALPETAASVVIAAAAIGAAVSLLSRTSKFAESIDDSLKPCGECGGTGICSECNGNGFVLKKLSEESAERARLTAKNMATRYTAGLPKKWSYCSKCSASRSCKACGGLGRMSS